MLILGISQKEKIRIGEAIVFVRITKNGHKIYIDAPKNITVERVKGGVSDVDSRVRE